jgi:hypothetical protein
LNLFTKLNESNACPNYIYLVLPVQPNPYGPKPARILQHKNQGDSNIWSYQNILFKSDFIITLLYFPLD